MGLRVEVWWGLLEVVKWYCDDFVRVGGGEGGGEEILGKVFFFPGPSHFFHKHVNNFFRDLFTFCFLVPENEGVTDRRWLTKAQVDGTFRAARPFWVWFELIGFCLNINLASFAPLRQWLLVMWNFPIPPIASFLFPTLHAKRGNGGGFRISVSK